MAKIQCLIRDKEVNATKEERVRQSFLSHLIFSLEYPKSLIKVEVPIKHGSSEVLDVETRKKKRADIVIYENELHEDIKAIVEVKKQHENSGWEQIKSYGNVTNAKYLVWHNGSDITLTWKRVKVTGSWRWKKIGFLPHFGFEDGDYIPNKKDLENIQDLRGLFESINSAIWVNSNIKNKKDIFLQFIYVLFTKLFDEKYNTKPQFYILDSEYEKIIKTGNCKKFKKRFLELFEELTTNPSFQDIFDNSDRIKLEPHLLGEIVYKLQYLKITGTDIKGEAFQMFLSPYYRGENDQFLTPEPVIKMIVEIIKPSIKDVIIDPACGTGRFLTNTISYLRNNIEDAEFSVKEWASEHIFGIETDTMLSKISKIYMVLIGDGHTNIYHRNSLTNSVDSYEVTRNKITIAITNPPFGSKEKITSRNVLHYYDLGYDYDNDELVKTANIKKNGQGQGILMLERCIQFLTKNGLVGIVMPDGVLSNLGDKYIRSWIVNNCEILAIISLPEETFRTKIIGANVKTSVLILRKKAGTKNHNIFFGIPKTVGYDFSGYPIKSNEVLDVPKYYKNIISDKSTSNTQYFTTALSNEELIDRMDTNFYSNMHNSLLSSEYTINNFCDVFTGKTPSKSDYLDNGEIKILKVRCLTNEMIDWSDKNKDYVTKKWFSKLTNEIDVQKDDILIAAAHVAKYIGDEIDIVDHIPNKYKAAIASAKINVIRVKDKNEINPYVLLCFLRSQEGYNAVQSIVRGQTGEIYPQDIYKVKIPSELIKLSQKKGVEIEKKQKNLMKAIRNSRNKLQEIEKSTGMIRHSNILLNQYEYIEKKNTTDE